MSGLAIKITTLIVRTVSKPIANRIKAQAREHDGFRRACVAFAQSLHRIDIRLRLGLLHDAAAADRVAEKAAAAKLRAEAPTVLTEAQTRARAGMAGTEGEAAGGKGRPPRPKIKPLSEAKAIDTGANVIAEGFLFAVAVGTLLFDNWRGRRKAAARRSDVADKLAALEARDREKRGRIAAMEAELRALRRARVGGGQWQGGERGLPAAAAAEHAGAEAAVGEVRAEELRLASREPRTSKTEDERVMVAAAAGR